MSVALSSDVHPAAPDEDPPRADRRPASLGDQVFRGILRGAGITVLVITAMILVFLVHPGGPRLPGGGIPLLHHLDAGLSATTSSASPRCCPTRC